MAIYVTERQVQPLVDKVDELVSQVESGGGSGASAFVIDLTGVEFELTPGGGNYQANLSSTIEAEVLLEAIKSGALIKYENLGDYPAPTANYFNQFMFIAGDLASGYLGHAALSENVMMTISTEEHTVFLTFPNPMA